MYRFEHPNFLYFLILGLFILALLWFTYLRWKTNTFKKLADENLHDHIIVGRSRGKSVWKFIFSVLIFTLLILSITNLQVGGKLEKKAHAETIDIILCFDISRSMLCEDIRPNRLERAKMFSIKLTEELKFANIGIVLFAADAFVYMPITSDKGAVKMFLRSVTTDLITLQGTAIGKALESASAAFERTKAKNKAVILISDGENFEDDAIISARIARDNNIVIHSVSLGTAEGGPIPLKEKGKIVGYKKDKNNNTVITRPDFDLLADVAYQTGGISVDGNYTDRGIENIISELDKLEKTEGKAIKFSKWHSLFHLFAIPALFLLVLDFVLVERKMKWQEILDALLKFNLKK